MTTWEAVIGIETHVELSTASKMFCACRADTPPEPNTACCPVCLALPGALPVANERAISDIVKIGLSLDCEINESSLFYRKSYFYPDLPKNYQISQYTFPVCENGTLDLDVDGEIRTIGITRVHMEEDTGKSTHVGGGDGRIYDADYTLLDFNRAGVPLVEIVSEPDISSAKEARAYGAEIQRIVLALGVSDAKLEAGSMRFDVNVSVRPVGETEFGTRTETKNVNSLRSVERTVDFEIERQITVLEGGGEIVLETRHWNENTGRTSSMRPKEESEDYRYFQDPDLLPLELPSDWQEAIRETLPELPAARRKRFITAGVDNVTAGVLVDTPALASMFEAAVAEGAPARSVGIWLTGEVVAHTRRRAIAISDTALTSDHIVELIAMIDRGELSSSAAKQVLAGVLDGEGTPRDVAESEDLLQVSDTGAIEEAIAAVLEANPDALDKIHAGDMKPFGFLVGQVMRHMGGRADPKVVQSLLRTATTP